MRETSYQSDNCNCNCNFIVVVCVLVTKGGADEAEDAALTQTDYRKALGNDAVDSTYVRFLSRIQRGGNDQILRYPTLAGKEETSGCSFIPVPLQVHSKSMEGIEIPCCENCGSVRRFEFQVIPI